MRKLIGGILAAVMAVRCLGLTALAEKTAVKSISEDFSSAVVNGDTGSYTVQAGNTNETTTLAGTDFNESVTVYDNWIYNSIKGTLRTAERTTGDKYLNWYVPGVNNNNAPSFYGYLTLPETYTGDDVRVSFDMLAGGPAIGHATTGNGAVIALTDGTNEILNVRYDTQWTNWGKFYVNGTATNVYGDISGSWYTIEATLNFTTKKVTSLVIKSGEEAKYTAESAVDFVNTSADNVTTVKIGYDANSGDNKMVATTNCDMGIDNFSLAVYEETPVNADKIEVKTEENETKDAAGFTHTFKGSANSVTWYVTDGEVNKTVEFNTPVISGTGSTVIGLLITDVPEDKVDAMSATVLVK